MRIEYDNEKYGNISYEPTSEEWQDFFSDKILYDNSGKLWEKFCEMFEEEIEEYFKAEAIEAHEDYLDRQEIEKDCRMERYYR